MNVIAINRLTLAFAAAVLLAVNLTAQAVTVGAGTGIPLEVVDTAGSQPRTNVDQSFTQTLPAGVYVVRDWSYAAGQSGSVTPFAAVANGVDSYSVAALGSQVNLGGAVTTTSNFGRSNTFVLTAPTTVFAGITNPPGSQNPIFLDNLTATQTDHDGTPTTITGINQTVNGFSNPNLGRTYAFSLNVDTRATLRAGGDVTTFREVLDNADGPRMNIDRGSALVLPAGYYKGSDFSFAAGRIGEVTPFLATFDGVNYKVIATGATVTTETGDTIHTVDFGGSDIIQLTAPTTIFAGITNPNGSNPIYLDDGVGLTAHDGSPSPLPGTGGLIPVAGISHPSLTRTYAFSIGLAVVPVPEPASAVLGLMGLGVLAMRRKRTA